MAAPIDPTRETREAGTTHVPILSRDDIRQLQLERYSGPFDLLLALVRKRQVDILQIPIAEITGDYLRCMEVMREELSLEISGDFLAMASVLVNLKSRRLLPAAETDLLGDDGASDEDALMPRSEEELVRRLLEFERFQTAAEELWRRPVLDRDVFARDDDLTVRTGRAPEPVGVLELTRAFNDVMRRQEPMVMVSEDRLRIISIPEAVERILSVLSRGARTSFRALVGARHSRGDAVQLFCALLELARWGFVHLEQDVVGNGELEVDRGDAEPDRDALDKLLAATSA